MKKKLVISILLVITCIICVLGIAACNNDKPDDSGNGQGTVQTPPDEKPDDKDKPTGSEKPSEVEVTGVTLNKTTLSLEVGNNETLTATVAPSNATDKTVTWKSSDNTVAKVENGKVTALKAGSATITATAGGKSVNCNVTVTENVIAVTDVSLNKTVLSLEEGKNETLTATVVPSNATDKTVIWTSSDTSVATVQNGVVKAIAAGETTVTVTSHNGITTTCTVIVPDPYADFKFGLMANKTYALTDYSGSNVNVSVPSTYKGLPVTLIYNYAFTRSNIEHIVLPDTIEQIGMRAFAYCASLRTVTITSCFEIENETFINCSELTDVKLPDNLQTIGSSAFSGCKNLNDFKVPNNVSYIGSSAFSGCTGLKSITLPFVSSNTGSTSCFYNNFGSSATDVPASLESVIITGGTTIVASAFKNCNNIKNITLPAGLIEIRGEAFQNCSSLTSINIPVSVTQINGYAFDGCNSLKSAIFDGNGNWKVYRKYQPILDTVTITSVQLADPAIAAKYLSSTYTGTYYWERI